MTKLDGWRRAAIVAGIVVLVDQATKAWIVATRELGERTNVFLGIDLNYVQNRGVAFGGLSGQDGVIVLVSIALSGLLIFFLLNADKRLVWLPVGVIAGGAIGNLADRARAGAVVDFIDPIAWPAFNIADICIVVGVLGLVYLMEGKRPPDDDEEKPEPSEPARAGGW
jgi:signal peptidase II